MFSNGLVKLYTRDMDAGIRFYGDLLGLTETFPVVLWTDDVDRVHGVLESAGVTSEQPPHDTGNDHRNALVRDPDGNLVELVSKRS